MIFRSGKTHSGVLLRRLRNESPAHRVHVVESILERYAGRLAGHFVVATESNVRIRSPM